MSITDRQQRVSIGSIRRRTRPLLCRRCRYCRAPPVPLCPPPPRVSSSGSPVRCSQKKAKGTTCDPRPSIVCVALLPTTHERCTHVPMAAVTAAVNARPPAPVARATAVRALLVSRAAAPRSVRQQLSLLRQQRDLWAGASRHAPRAAAAREPSQVRAARARVAASGRGSVPRNRLCARR